jgi:hypothetical protein
MFLRKECKAVLVQQGVHGNVTQVLPDVLSVLMPTFRGLFGLIGGSALAGMDDMAEIIGAGKRYSFGLSGFASRRHLSW